MQFKLKPKGAQLSDQQMLDDLRRVADVTSKRYIPWRDYNSHGQFSSSSISKRFGTWKRALVEAGLDSEDTPKATKELLIEDLRRVAKICGKEVLTIPNYQEHGRWSQSPIVRIFGGWIDAVKAADLTPGTDRVSDEELFENLQEVWTKLGRQPTYSEVSAPTSRYSRGTYSSRFGGWGAALEAFILWISAKSEDASNDEVARPSPMKQHALNIGEGTSARQPKRTPREINLRLRFRVLQTNRFSCVACGRSPTALPGLALHVDHIVPWSKGGETIVANLQTLCEHCKLGKSNMTVEKLVV